MLLLIAIFIHLLVIILTYIDIKKSNNRKKATIITSTLIIASFIICINLIYNLGFIRPTEMIERLMSILLMR